MKYSSGKVPAPWYSGRLRMQEREQAGQEQAQREAVAEPRPPQQERRPEAQPAGGPDGTGQVPRPVERLVPAAQRGERLGAGGDAVEQHPERPDELEPAASDTPLVEQQDGERRSARTDVRAGSQIGGSIVSRPPGGWR